MTVMGYCTVVKNNLDCMLALINLKNHNLKATLKLFSITKACLKHEEVIQYLVYEHLHIQEKV